MIKLACPACGAEVQFKSGTSVFGVCSFCRSMLVRRDLNLDNLGKMAELPEDSSPLQIGARGKFEGRGFELVGRLKISWDEGTWNEWFAVFDDGREGWVAEAQGYFMVSFAVEDAGTLPPLQQLEVGRHIRLREQNFEVDDIKQVTCVGSEGELPFSGAKGRKSTSVDLNAPGGGFATLDYSPDEGTRLYLGKSQEFDDLKFTGLRQLDGW